MRDRFEQLADLAVRVGANVQPGQIVSVASEPGKEALTRATAAAAYKAGAKFVDVQWFDPWVKRERVLHAPDDTLEFVPPWYGERLASQGFVVMTIDTNTRYDQPNSRGRQLEAALDHMVEDSGVIRCWRNNGVGKPSLSLPVLLHWNVATSDSTNHPIETL